MSNVTRICPNFAANYGWVTNKTHTFRPREVTDVIKNMLAETLVRNDTQFRHVLRQCKDTWYLAVTVGHDTICMNIYDPSEVNDPTYHPMSSSVRRERTSFFAIDRNLDVRQLTPEQIDGVMRTHPVMYSTRSLRPTEVKMCDTIENTMMGRPEIPEPVAMVDDSDTYVDLDPRPDFTLEPSAISHD